MLYVVTASVELCVLCIVSISVKNCNVISAGPELCACDPHGCGVMYLWFPQVQAYVHKKDYLYT